MRTATNQAGFTVERHDGQLGWQSILIVPFATRRLAESHLRNMHKTPGAEYRVYPALVQP
jgi:hypothetical protein